MNRNLFIATLTFLGTIISYIPVCAQAPVSIHERQNREFNKIKVTEQQWDSINHYQPSYKPKSALQCQLKKVVFGWHPYWSGTYYNEYDFTLLSDVAYFSYEVDPATGSYTDIHYWKTTPMIDLAKAAGTRVSLAVTLFSGHSTFFNNAASRQTLIDSLVSLVKFRGANGVNIDFEAVPSSQHDNLTQFMKDLGTRFHTEIPGSIVSIALPSVDWGKTFDVQAMAPYVDLFIIMGYDYYYPGSSKAGPVSPKNNGQLWTPYDVTRSVRYYLQTGVPASKLCLGVPYYGYDWPTTDDLLNSNTTGKGTAKLYKDALANASEKGRLWDRNASVPYYIYYDGISWRQCWYDDETSLGYKYDMVNMYDIAGIGIWALGYDRTTQGLWNLLREKFSSCGNTSCSGYFTDMGGPEGSYFANDNYSFTISLRDTNSISAVFQNFNLAANDTLYIYDGKNTQSPVMGIYTKTQNPGVINSKTGDITFKFTSKSQISSGWEAFWSCGEILPSGALNLPDDSIAENSPPGTFIGRFQINDTVVANCHSSKCINYSLYGNDNSDNTYFKISGDSLFSAIIFNYEKQNNFQITVAGIDWKNRSIFNTFQIKILDRLDNSITDYSDITGIKIFPIPSTGMVHLEIPPKLNVSLIEIFDIRGLKVKGIDKGKRQFDSSLDLSCLSNGMYLLRMHTCQGIVTQKIIIHK
jgi:spore germination protein YaaH